ncbi:winged helix-turn-helix domain-containing protein [Thalassotalea sp. 1_MG-2023]|uniref:winged helix-turn-helix domain-containing protein n=1 Tax=Thalassotalea sp. 1_MG-2023 TaxID=3062680 RepID=UPI0026E31D4F|nr:winged helix-turn-helix domain-containing protein [Thalassotalea sp. 1_MG-2023]MDO6427939.1 winged helix-turn-helix domain-containing protein [Thalassotalea sp. 1_MG-2023]
MPTKFFIGQFYVDIQRNLIIIQQDGIIEEEHILPPKTIAVLQLLAKQQGEVLTTDYIIDQVWPDTVVSTNSLQRCITQLRKVLVISGDNQAIIKTHNKKGYCLEFPVNVVADDFSLSATKTSENSPTVTHKSKNVSQKSLFISASLLLILLLFITFINDIEQPTHRFSTIKQLTHSDFKEQYPSYAPDGDYLVFHRYDGRCNNNIWAINNTTKEEIQLTKSTDFYGPHRFSSDGKKLIFLAKNACTESKKEQNPKQCWKVMSLDFDAALSSPQAPIELANCRQGKLNYPTWLDNGSIAILRGKNETWRLAKYMLNAADSVDIYNPKNKQLYYFDYLAAQQQFVVLSKDKSNQHWRELISITGNIISSTRISIPQSFNAHRNIRPFAYDGKGRHFFATGKNIYTLHDDGSIKHFQQLPFINTHQYALSPDGTSLLASRGRLDNDVAQVTLTSTVSDTVHPNQINQVTTDFPSLYRSTAQEHSGKFQPLGKQIAFVSNRSGQAQIWLGQENRVKQLTFFPIDSQLSNFQWHPKGAQMLVANNRQLWLIDIDGTASKLKHPHSVTKVYQWITDNEVLVSSFNNDKNHVSLLSLSSGKLTNVFSEPVRWAQYTPNGNLILLDDSNTFWQKDDQVIKQLSALNNQSARKEFLLEKQNIYSVNKNGQLWRYHLDTHEFSVINQKAHYLSSLTDIKNYQMLATQVVTDKKDIVEIY